MSEDQFKCKACRREYNKKFMGPVDGVCEKCTIGVNVDLEKMNHKNRPKG